MTEREKDWTVFGALGLFLVWVLWHLLHRNTVTGSHGLTSPAPATGPEIVVAPAPALPSETTGSGCGCGPQTGCAVSTAEVPTLQQMSTVATAAANTMYSAANSTMEAIAQVGQSTDPWLTLNPVSTTG